jgi:hypothetical protein
VPATCVDDRHNPRIVTRALPTLAVLALLAGCGGSSGDLIAFEVSGGFQGGTTTISVTEDGRGSCDQGPLQAIEGQTLLEARDLHRALGPLAASAREFGEPGPDQRQYVVRMQEGSVSWPEGGRDLPPELGRAVVLERSLEQQLCG